MGRRPGPVQEAGRRGRLGRRGRMTAPSGLVIVDKPGGMTSHDVIARIRRIAGTRRVGHAGTLDPMATGVLVVGVEKATRLLGYLTLTEKVYAATIRLGQSTSTDDAEGELTGGAPASGVSAETLGKEIASLTGEISQVPPGVSAIKVGGQRAYKLTRAGAAPELAAARSPSTSSRSPASVPPVTSWTSMPRSAARAARTSARWRATSAWRSAPAGTSPP